jgi:hypothetical protein
VSDHIPLSTKRLPATGPATGPQKEKETNERTNERTKKKGKKEKGANNSRVLKKINKKNDLATCCLPPS